MNNSLLAKELVDAWEQIGVKECVFCSGARSYPLLVELKKRNHIQLFTFPEERSAAFFALGRSRLKKEPVCIITTSGTAAGELLPACMEAYYSGDPLLLVTSDRPRRYRGSGAPQSAEQVGLFQKYVEFELDISAGESCSLNSWSQTFPAHQNVCFEDPLRNESKGVHSKSLFSSPLVIVSRLSLKQREPVINYLRALGAPCYLEATSGLREEPSLAHLRVYQEEKILENSSENDYPIDGILRIGGVPTLSFWRELSLPVRSYSELPFKGLEHGEMLSELPSLSLTISPEKWLKAEDKARSHLNELLDKYPQSEPAFIRALSQFIPSNSFIYLGNSQPIRHWDLAATYEISHPDVAASRGLNGIDGQISTFLGMCRSNTPNIAIIGDLTALYDLAAFWAMPQMENRDITVVVINNGGGGIFSRVFAEKELQNCHRLRYSSIAEFWGLSHSHQLESGKQLIELLPDLQQTEAFWDQYKNMHCMAS
ncbi:MAG: thiamine pyrophosphate-binding protein [Waddliaceae bacterium]